MIIRKCQKEDILKVSLFYDKVILYLDNHVNYPKWKYKIYPSILSVTKMTVEGYQYVCLDDNQNIIGSFVLNYDPEGSYFKVKWSKIIKKYMVIHAFAIDPSMHGKGIGTKALEFCLEHAKKEGCEGIRLDVVPTNYPAKSFYEKNGFKYVSDVNLDRNIEDILLFSVFELYF